MNLPNYFLADLPANATLGPEMLAEACRALKRNRETYLKGRSTHSLVATFVELAGNWLRPDFPFRKMALSASPHVTGFSAGTLARGLDAFFRELTGPNFEALLLQDLGNVRRLDEVCATAVEQKLERASVAHGPELLVHFLSDTVPSSLFLSLILGILVRSAQFAKCAPEDLFLARLFAHSIYEMEPKLGACLEIAQWSGNRSDLTEPLFHEADCLLARGEDEALLALRGQLGRKVRCLTSFRKVSFGYITREALSGFNVPRLAAQAAVDVAAWNQRGSAAPHLYYVETGGRVSDEDFADLLARALADLEETEPRGALSHAAAAEIAHRRALYKIRAAHSPETRQWCSPDSTAWTVIHEAEPRFQPSCLNRFVYVKPVKDLTQALQAADSVHGRVETVGLGANEDRCPSLAAELAAWGVGRVCPVGQMQSPPLTARRDGRPSLGDLVTWTDWEKSG